ncbi:hypothetical protein GH714_025017 [Hevea brasiliensis]|uniref:Uncharacterized protein n=1 Tax=Hevea brasiliensis TaxID=3981 RepID=A0A6A6N412_HEVBR|nr:hypothetical protein GH714_025017 [Hevea brasiliensis]
MPALQVLNLSRTSIKSLPESLFKLFNLRRLFLNHCDLITTLSSKVGELKQLEVLDLEGTEIVYLPKEVGQLTNLTCLEVSFFEPTSQRRLEQSGEIIPCGAISALSQLEELNIDMSCDDKRWNASAEAVVSEICKLESLHTLKVYFPKVKLLSHLHWNEENMAFPSLSYFKFTVGHLVERIISRVSCDTELELERHDRYLKYVNGEGVPGDIKKVLRHSTAFFLDRNSTISRLSDFGYRNMQQLKCLVAGQCNELQAIIGGDQIESSSCDATVGLVSLEYMHIYYMKNLRSIWEGPVNDSSFNSLKCLTLRTCPELTTVFTPRLLTNFSNLEELTIRDCPKITTLVSCDSCDHNITSILPALKRISLHFLPKLTSISSGLLMAPMLELMSFQYCLNLKSPRQLPSNVIDSTNINSWELLMVLERMKFLLILHDVRQFISLEKVGIPRPTAENGCKIVLIARSEEVCDAMGVDSKIGLKDLSSWELFHGNVGEVADSSSLKPLATQVLNMCADYSLAIVLMAGH